MENKYKEHEKFFEITFELSSIGNEKEFVSQQINKFVTEFLKHYPEAVNIKVIPCRMILEPRRLSVSKDDYSYSVYNNKEKSQIKDCRYDSKYGSLECNDCKEDK